MGTPEKQAAGLVKWSVIEKLRWQTSWQQSVEVLCVVKVRRDEVAEQWLQIFRKNLVRILVRKLFEQD
jgi:hypothetical protein